MGYICAIGGDHTLDSHGVMGNVMMYSTVCTNLATSYIFMKTSMMPV